MKILCSALLFALFTNMFVAVGGELTNNVPIPVSHRGAQDGDKKVFKGNIDPALNEKVEAALVRLEADVNLEESVAREVQSLLTNIVSRTSKGEGARQSLRRIGGKALPSLVRLLSNEDPSVRRQAIALVAGIVSDAKEGTPFTEEWRASPGPSCAQKLKPVLLRSLNDVDAEVQLVAANVLLMVDTQTGAKIVVQCLDREEAQQKANLARLLIRYGHKSLLPEAIRRELVSSGYNE